MRVPNMDLLAPLETASCSGSANPFFGMWQVAHDCPIGFESVESKKIFFPRIWDGLSVISEFNSACIELIDGVSGAEVRLVEIPARDEGPRRIGLGGRRHRSRRMLAAWLDSMLAS